MINFVLTKSINYQLVEQQINFEIQRYLPKGSWSQSFVYEPGKLNFTLFIDCDADVFMSHGAADKDYFLRPDLANQNLLLNNHLRRKHLLVPGPWLKTKMLNHPDMKFGPASIHVVGWPCLDVLTQKRALVI
jgi:hypothetical protein